MSTSAERGVVAARRERMKPLEGINKDAVIQVFYDGAWAVAHPDNATDAQLDIASQLVNPAAMLGLLGLDDMQPDGLTFEARFLKGIADEELAHELSNKENTRLRARYYIPPIRAVKESLDCFETGAASEVQVQFLQSMGTAALRQFEREKPELFCDMAADFWAWMARQVPGAFALGDAQAILNLPVPHDRERHFTGRTDRILQRSAQTVHDLL